MGLNNSDKESLVINWSQIKSINGLNNTEISESVNVNSVNSIINFEDIYI